PEARRSRPRAVAMSGDDTRRRAASQVLRQSSAPIAGYTGYMPGVKPEGVHAATYAESLKMSRVAMGRRGREPGEGVMTLTARQPGTFDGGSLNTSLGMRIGDVPQAK
ncbi:unnamed protein product, partial [Polarella glacialis]